MGNYWMGILQGEFTEWELTGGIFQVTLLILSKSLYISDKIRFE